MQNQKWYTRKRVLLPVTAVLALLLGVGLGAGTPPPEAKAPEPVTKTETKVQIKEKRVEVEVVPEVCLKALDSAEKVMDVAGDFAGITQSYIALIPRSAEAGALMDTDELGSITDEMKDLTEQTEDLTKSVNGSNYPEQSSQCRLEERSKS